MAPYDPPKSPTDLVPPPALPRLQKYRSSLTRSTFHWVDDAATPNTFGPPGLESELLACQFSVLGVLLELRGDEQGVMVRVLVDPEGTTVALLPSAAADGAWTVGSLFSPLSDRGYLVTLLAETGSSVQGGRLPFILPNPVVLVASHPQSGCHVESAAGQHPRAAYAQHRNALHSLRPERAPEGRTGWIGALQRKVDRESDILACILAIRSEQSLPTTLANAVTPIVGAMAGWALAAKVGSRLSGEGGDFLTCIGGAVAGSVLLSVLAQVWVLQPFQARLTRRRLARTARIPTMDSPPTD